MLPVGGWVPICQAELRTVTYGISEFRNAHFKGDDFIHTDAYRSKRVLNFDIADYTAVLEIFGDNTGAIRLDRRANDQ